MSQPTQNKQSLSFLPNEPVTKENVIYFSRPMSLSLWTKVAGPMFQRRSLLKESFAREKTPVWFGLWDVQVWHPIYLIHPLDVLSLILISKVKVKYNHFCLENLLRFLIMTMDTVKWDWALNLGFAPLEGKCTDICWVNQAELCTLHVSFL